MPYALIPDGYSLKQVTKLQKKAVDDKRRHDNVVAFLSNETTPVVIGATGLIAIAPVLIKLFANDSDISLSDKQKEALEKSLIATLPGIGPIINVITALGDT